MFLTKSDVVDRPFTENTDILIVSHELKGKSLSTLAPLLNRSLRSLVEHRQELFDSGKYDEYARSIKDYQLESVVDFANRRKNNEYFQNVSEKF